MSKSKFTIPSMVLALIPNMSVPIHGVVSLFTYTSTMLDYRANDIQQELDEYTENSAQLEKELEASLMQTEKQNRDLEHQNQRLKNEIESLRVCSFKIICLTFMMYRSLLFLCT